VSIYNVTKYTLHLVSSVQEINKIPYRQK